MKRWLFTCLKPVEVKLVKSQNQMDPRLARVCSDPQHHVNWDAWGAYNNTELQLNCPDSSLIIMKVKQKIRRHI